MAYALRQLNYPVPTSPPFDQCGLVVELEAGPDAPAFTCEWAAHKRANYRGAIIPESLQCDGDAVQGEPPEQTDEHQRGQMLSMSVTWLK